MSNGHYRVALRPSRLAGGIILSLGGTTLALAMLLPVTVAIKFPLVAWIGGLALDAYRVVALRAGRGAREVLVHGSEIVVADGRGRQRAGHLQDGSFVAPWLTILRWRPHRARFDRTILILPDMLSCESFRELRVWLKWS